MRICDALLLRPRWRTLFRLLRHICQMKNPHVSNSYFRQTRREHAYHKATISPVNGSFLYIIHSTYSANREFVTFPMSFILKLQACWRLSHSVRPFRSRFCFARVKFVESNERPKNGVAGNAWASFHRTRGEVARGKGDFLCIQSHCCHPITLPVACETDEQQCRNPERQQNNQQQAAAFPLSI